MKHRFIFLMFLFCFALCPAMVTPVSAENLLEVVDAAQIVIRKKYPERDSLARKMAMEELENTARCGESDEQIIKFIMEKFPETSDELFAKSDLNRNGIPDDWEKEMHVSDEYSSPESDEDSDGFNLLQEYKAKTNPTDPLSHPKYITQVYVDAVSQQRFTGLELVSVDRTKSDKKDWKATFNVVRNNRKRSEFVQIGVSTFKNNNVDFSVVDIEIDDKTQDPIVYIQRVGKTERIPCRPKQAVYDPAPRVRFLNALFDRTFISSVGAEFKLGTEKTGEELYKVVSADPSKKEAVVESSGENPETYTLKLAPKEDSADTGRTLPPGTPTTTTNGRTLPPGTPTPRRDDSPFLQRQR